ncbi:hypothetical protein LJC60_06410 [Ruminococcaceae bacterium OttesenSCG-928-D13]|nr:hypothetical protein [Ruminococcaceae bacterium OttesenSCG-928-D13]
MKLKRIVALLLVCALLALTMTGCIGNFYENAGTIDGVEISSGLYLMAQFNAYFEARNLAQDADNVLKEKIEGEKASKWIQNRTEELLRRFVAILKISREKKISLSSEGQQNVESAMQYWDYMVDMYTENGVSEATVRRFNTNSELAGDIFDALYGEGGELQVSDADLKAEYTEKYAHIRFFSIPTSKLDPSTDMTTEVSALTDAMVARLYGGATLEDVVLDDVESVYTDVLERDVGSANTVESITSSYVNLYPENFETYSEDFLEELKNQSVGDFGSYNMGATIIVYEKIEMFADDEEFQNQRTTILTSLKSEAFEDYLSAAADAYQVKWALGARNYLRPSKIEY